jgi:hypothetical protein
VKKTFLFLTGITISKPKLFGPNLAPLKRILLFPLLVIQILASAQCLIPGGLTDSLFPVTNSVLEAENAFGTSFVYRYGW